MSHINEHHNACECAIAEARHFINHHLPEDGYPEARAIVFVARIIGGSILSTAVVLVDIAAELKKIRKHLDGS